MMKKEWKKPEVELLNVQMTMDGRWPWPWRPGKPGEDS